MSDESHDDHVGSSLARPLKITDGFMLFGYTPGKQASRNKLFFQTSSQDNNNASPLFTIGRLSGLDSEKHWEQNKIPLLRYGDIFEISSEEGVIDLNIEGINKLKSTWRNCLSFESVSGGGTAGSPVRFGDVVRVAVRESPNDTTPKFVEVTDVDIKATESPLAPGTLFEIVPPNAKEETPVGGTFAQDSTGKHTAGDAKMCNSQDEYKKGENLNIIVLLGAIVVVAILAYMVWKHGGLDSPGEGPVSGAAPAEPEAVASSSTEPAPTFSQLLFENPNMSAFIEN